MIVAAVAFLGLLWLFLHRTRWGWALRASAQDPEAAALQGIPIGKASAIAMGIGTALAGVAGALTAPLVRTYPFMGHSVIVAAFIVIIVGGVGSLEGAVLAAIAYATVHTFVTTFIDGGHRGHCRASHHAWCADRPTYRFLREPRACVKGAW